MSAAAAPAATPGETAVPAKGKKKLVIMLAAVLLLVVLGGAGAWLLLKKKAADNDDEASETATATAQSAGPAKPAARDPKAVPIFVPLDPFTVNLADREAERYAQIGITLEIADAKIGDQIKQFMPAIRNAVLMLLADKTAAQILDRQGKLKLAQEVQREASRALGFDVGDAPEAEAGDAARKKPAKKPAKKAPAELPIRAVHFSNFIVQ